MTEDKAYRGDHQQGEIEILEEVPVYQNKFATLYDDKVKFPSGSEGRYLRFCWNAPYGVFIFATDRQGRPLLIRNFRHETRSWGWEIPKGFGVAGLSPMDCAAKELREETGFTGVDWACLKSIHDKNLQTHIFTTTLLEAAGDTEREAEEAIADVRFFDHSELEQLIYGAEISDPMTLFFLTRCLLSVN